MIAKLVKEERIVNAVLADEVGVLELAREGYEDADDDEVMRISECLLEKHKRAFIALANCETLEEGKKYLASYEDVKSISDELIEQNTEAYLVLANK